MESTILSPPALKTLMSKERVKMSVYDQRPHRDIPYGFELFRDKVILKPGFYVFWYIWRNSPEQKVYVGDLTQYHAYTYSYFCTYPNPEKDRLTCCDLGGYTWVNHYRGDGPTAWRCMTEEEEHQFRLQLFRFDRPKPDWCTRPFGIGPSSNPKFRKEKKTHDQLDQTLV